MRTNDKAGAITDEGKELRVSLYNSYQKKVEHTFFAPTQDNETLLEEQFTKLTAKWMLEANKAYNFRSIGYDSGIYYAEDYIRLQKKPNRSSNRESQIFICAKKNQSNLMKNFHLIKN